MLLSTVRYNMEIRSDITVFIGENGCGKSEILNELSIRYTKRGRNVIAIAHCIHDKFESSLFNNKNFNFLGARFGSEMTKNALKEVIKELGKKNRNRVNISQVFEYIGYSPFIGMSIELNIPALDSLSSILSKSISSEIRHSNVESLISSYSLIARGKKLIWFDFVSNNYSSIEGVKYGELISYEEELIRLGVIRKVNYYLRKDKKTINLENASSGELYQIANFSFIASKITENSIIFIDEPENSLHPKWQNEYIRKLYDSFYLYSPKFVLATHSPFILSNLNLGVSNLRVSINRVKEFETTPLQYDALNVEGILWDMFEVITPESNFLSDLLVKLMNDLSVGEVRLEYVKNYIDRLRSSTSDNRQKLALEEVRVLAEKLVSRENE